MKRIFNYLLAAVMLITLCPAAVHADTNLLENAGFEEELRTDGEWHFPSPGGWYGEDGSSITAEQHYEGASSLLINEGTTGQRVSLEAGKTYMLSAFLKADASTDKPLMTFSDGANDWPGSSHVAQTALNVTSGWQEFTLELECTSSKDYVITFQNWDSGINVYVDSVTLCEYDAPYDGGGVVNGDFAGGTDGWTLDGGQAEVSDNIITVSNARLYQTVTNLENGVYNLSAYAKTDKISGVSYLYGKTAGHTMASTSVPMTDTIQKVVVPNIIVEDGTCDIGLYTQGGDKVSLTNVSLSAAEDTRVPFLKGGEISKLTYVEDKDGKFYYADGTEGDALQIMAENGFNLARIRLLDNPGKGRGDGTYYLPEGYMTEEDCLNLARRAKDKGMQIMFSIAYSDYWVDADKQMVPHAWQEEIDALVLSGEELVSYLEDKVYDYTFDILKKLEAQNTIPEYVSIGNEVQVGILFNKRDGNNGLYNNSAYLARLLEAGAKAVKDASPDSKVVLHSDNGGNLYRRGTFIDALRKMDRSLFDVIGVSYYPYWSSKTASPNNTPLSIDDVVNDFTKVINEFDKDVIIMETGYNWAELRGDNYEGQLRDSGYYQDIYGESRDGQRAFLTELYSKMKQVLGGRCIGDLYWDPVMIYDGGKYVIGWAIKEDGDWTDANVVSNSTIFDFDGKEVAGQQAMKYNTNSSDNIIITGTVRCGDDILENADVILTVNGTEYKTSTDKFGQYIASVPYPESGTFSISSNLSDETFEKDAPYDGIIVDGVDINTRGYIRDVSMTEENGIVRCSVDYEAEDGTLLFISAFDENALLSGCSVNTANAEFNSESTGQVKVYLWDENMVPLCDAMTAIIK